MKKALLIILAVFVMLAIFAVTIGEKTLLNVRAKQTQKTTLTELEELLAPNLLVRTPDPALYGPGPYPVVFQFHGCAGARLEFQELMVKAATENGYAAAIVDSFRPRDYSRKSAVETICAGKTLIGQERAGDVAAAIDLILERDDIDRDTIILAGWSHGAWTVMDYMTMDFVDFFPSNLSTENLDFSPPQIEGVILYYPYCGIGSRTRTNSWKQKPEVLALIAGADTIVNHKDCLKQFAKLQKNGVNIKETVYSGVQHAFDDPFIEEAYSDWHDPESTKDAMKQYINFINRLKKANS